MTGGGGNPSQVESYRLGRQIRVFLPFFYVFASVIVVTALISMSSTEAYLTSRDNSEPESDRMAGVPAAGW